jgi:hypothetical protein
MPVSGWIGVDLDGTLAQYDGWRGPDHIGDPVPEMLFRVRKWLADGVQVRIFTARANIAEQVPPIEAWCEQHFGIRLPITATKDFGMVELWDDRAVRVQANRGCPCCDHWRRDG